MCIAICKPKNVEIPKMEIFEQCFKRNKDGAGVVWLEDGKLKIRKGFMTFLLFKEFIEELCQKIDTTQTLMGFHFRIKTHGEISPNNTHPFPLSENMEDLKQLDFETNGKVAIHNGIIRKFSGTLKNSDTQEFITQFLSPLNAGCPNWENNDKLVKLVENMLGSKMCVFNTDGTYKILGTGWTEDGGVWYSNTSYKNYSTYTSRCYTCYDYDDDDDIDYYGYGYGYRNNYVPFQEKEQIKSRKAILLSYFDQNNCILITKKEFEDKKFENNLLLHKTNLVLAIDEKNNIYEYDISNDGFKIKRDYIVLNTDTLEPIEYNEDNSILEEII